MPVLTFLYALPCCAVHSVNASTGFACMLATSRRQAETGAWPEHCSQEVRQALWRCRTNTACMMYADLCGWDLQLDRLSVQSRVLRDVGA